MAQITDSGLHIDDKCRSLAGIRAVSSLSCPSTGSRSCDDIAFGEGDEHGIGTASHPIIFRRLPRCPRHITADCIGQENRSCLRRIAVDRLAIKVSFGNVYIHGLVCRIDRMGHIHPVFIGPESHFLTVDCHRFLFILRRIQIEAIRLLHRSSLGRFSLSLRSRRYGLYRFCFRRIRRQHQAASHHEKQRCCAHLISTSHITTHLSSKIVLIKTISFCFSIP